MSKGPVWVDRSPHFAVMDVVQGLVQRLATAITNTFLRHTTEAATRAGGCAGSVAQMDSGVRVHRGPIWFTCACRDCDCVYQEGSISISKRNENLIPVPEVFRCDRIAIRLSAHSQPAYTSWRPSTNSSLLTPRAILPTLKMLHAPVIPTRRRTWVLLKPKRPKLKMR